MPLRSQLSMPLTALALLAILVAFGIPSAHAVSARPALVRLAPSSGAGSVIIELRSGSFQPAGARHLLERRALIQRTQAPLLAQLKSAHARSVHSLWLINAISARVDASEIERLRADPSVKAIVPDSPMQMVGSPASTAGSPKIHPATRGRTPSPACDSRAKALLEPEALQLTKTAFVSKSAPQAQNIVNGSGVTVAYLADDIDVNTPDLIRPNGKHVITTYKDFTGDGTTRVTSPGSEAFGDASSIAAQGRFVYNVDSYASSLLPQHKSCLPIRILGVAPGASIMALKILGQNVSTEAMGVEAVQYAVAHGANVINESVSDIRSPDSGFDPFEAANDAAVAAGVVVVGISWDGGTAGGTMLPPGTDPHIITAGASTQFQSYRQIFYGGSSAIKGGYTSDNISAISSSGVSDDGKKTVDVVAPGDLGWALCAPINNPNGYYGGCYDYSGGPSPIQLFGGTSEAAPLTAGEAALVIQAYRRTHKGVTPSPALVKQLIMSTATNLGAPAAEQGAGLINSFAAVQAAMSYRKNSRVGNAILTTPSDLTGTLNPGATAHFSISVTNDGAKRETVKPNVSALAAPFAQSHFAPYFDGATAKTYLDQYGSAMPYIIQRFRVPSGAQRLDAAIAWASLGDSVRLTVFDPHGNVSGYTLPQDAGYPGGPAYSEYGHIGIRDPIPGTWTAVISSGGDVAGPFKGTVHLSVSESRFAKAGIVSPVSRKLAPGQTASFGITVTSPRQAGDFEPQVNISGQTASGAPAQAGSIPILLRTQVPMGRDGGTFTGLLTGGNGRPGRGQSLNYSFKLRPGLRDVDLSLTLPDTGYSLEGVLSNPAGLPVDVQSTNTGAIKNYAPIYGKSMQFFRRSPTPGLWSLLVFVNDFISGREASEPFKGVIRFNRVSVSVGGVPDSAKTSIRAGSTRVATISIKNTGVARESFFVDPRLAKQQMLRVAGATYQLSAQTGTRTFFVPTETTRIAASAVSTSPSVPIESELINASGAYPYGYLYGPIVDGIPSVRGGIHRVDTTISAPELTPGWWQDYPTVIGPFTNPAPTTTITDGYTITTQAFDRTSVPSTGDAFLWELKDTTRYQPLILNPGATGEIKVSLRPSTTSKGTVRGDLFVDTFDLSDGVAITDSADEMKVIPYEYTVGR